MHRLGDELASRPEPPTASPELEEAIRCGIAACLALPNAPKGSPALLDVWTLIFAREGITPKEATHAFVAYLARNKWFPAPCEIIQRAKDSRPRRVAVAAPLPERRLTEEERETIRAERAKIREAMSAGGRRFMDEVVR